jgi:hypothetical protein
MERMMRLVNRSIKEQVEDHRRYFQTEYDPVFQILNPRMAKFFEKHASTAKGGSQRTAFPAVDIGAGRAVGTVTMALTYKTTGHAELIWTPSDWAGPEDSEGGPVEKETREFLRYHIQESKELAPLFTDQKGEPVFQGDGIELGGLKAVQFNGKRGRIQGPDPKTAGRFKVQHSPDPNDCKSFKKENISYLGEPTLQAAMLHLLRKQDEETEFYEGLLERTREIDVLRQETWSNVEELRGKCALVTCTSLLTCLAYRDPGAWKDTARLASKLLHQDGYLLQYDTIGPAKFGDASAMQAFADDESLGLKLETCTVPPFSEHNGQKRVIAVWRKNSSRV